MLEPHGVKYLFSTASSIICGLQSIHLVDDDVGPRVMGNPRNQLGLNLAIQVVVSDSGSGGPAK
jgi:hypothetical protein